MKQAVRTVMRQIARALNAVTGGHLHPNVVTAVGLLAFFPIGLYLIPNGHFVLAGVLTLVFGLFDTLDGELARLQNRSTELGMFLDSVTDRMKEILVYIGLGLFFAEGTYSQSLMLTDLFPFEVTPWIVTALGVSVLVSYTNAWGETVLAKAGKQPAKVNAALRGGFAPYEVRMALLALGLIIIGWLQPILIVIVILAILTVLDRSHRVIKQLR